LLALLIALQVTAWTNLLTVRLLFGILSDIEILAIASRRLAIVGLSVLGTVTAVCRHLKSQSAGVVTYPEELLLAVLHACLPS
jgi:hypothetical protein